MRDLCFSEDVIRYGGERTNVTHSNNYTTNSLNSDYTYVIFYVMFSLSKNNFKFIKKIRYYF